MFLKWLLIVAISMVSLTMLMFLSAYIAILEQARIYYKVQTKSSIIFLANAFNICYLVFAPCLFSVIKKYYFPIVTIATAFTGVGCIGRYFSGENYPLAVLFTMIVGISHVPMITAPYGLLDMFPKHHQGYASTIPLFIPILGINFCILYGLIYITPLDPQNLSGYIGSIEFLNGLIAVVALISCCLTIFCLFKLEEQVNECNKMTEEEKNNTNSFFGSLMREFQRQKLFFILAFSWGVILGVNWTYGGMFDVIFKSSDLNGSDRALIGLFANISSALFSNLGTWIINNTKYSNKGVIFFLNIAGLMGCVFIQASAIVDMKIFQDQFALIIAVIILRAGFSSFVSLALIKLNQFGMASVLVSSIFFYIANGANLAGNYIVDLLNNDIGLTVLSLIVFVCVVIVHFSKFSSSKSLYTTITEKMKNQPESHNLSANTTINSHSESVMTAELDEEANIPDQNL